MNEGGARLAETPRWPGDGSEENEIVLDP